MLTGNTKEIRNAITLYRLGFMSAPLPFRCQVEPDEDNPGCWQLVPPPDLTIFGRPGESYLLDAGDYNEAVEEAREFLMGVRFEGEAP